MRSTILYTLLIAGMLSVTLSCDDFLDVTPKGEVLSKELLTDAKGFENALYGVYASMRSSNLYGRHFNYYTLDVLAQYYTPTGGSNAYVSEVLSYRYDHSSVKSVLLNIWSSMYTNIAYTNNVLINLENYDLSDMKFHPVYKGEALGLRAFMHFDLLRLYTGQITLNSQAEGIPYNRSFSLKNPEALKAGAVYDCIIGDLREAEALLEQPALYETAPANASFLKDRATHFNLQAVQATLARVYLTTGNADSALYYAEKVIRSGKYRLSRGPELSGDVAGVLSERETIFGLYSKEIHESTYNDLYVSVTAGTLDPRSDLGNIYQRNRVGNDNRWDYWVKQSAGAESNHRLIKTVDPYVLNNTEYLRPDGQIRGVNLIRLPEMYYIAAECLLQKGRYNEALVYFNEVITSRGLVALDERDPAETLTIERITEERFKEFICEGQHFFHMKRLNLDISSQAGQTIPASDKIYVAPIPQEEYEYRN